jgi:hypothetical protein
VTSPQYPKGRKSFPNSNNLTQFLDSNHLFKNILRIWSKIMGQKLPFKRNCRCFMDGTFSGDTEYIKFSEFADSPVHYIRAYMLIQKDLINLFDYIEPSDANLVTYSFRIHELFIRTCIEIEANFRAILIENGYQKKSEDMNMGDYKKLNTSHRLSSFLVKIPYWSGNKSEIKPFEEFSHGKTPPWYEIYHSVKHNRSANFEKANMRNLINAVCGLVVLLASQFCDEDFTYSAILMAITSGGPGDGFKTAIGDYFYIKFPNDWPDEEKYDFQWHSIPDNEKQVLKLFEK